MTNGLVKERMTYFHENGTVYQAFNTLLNTAKVFVYVRIDLRYVCCAEFKVDHRITPEELSLIAIEYESLQKTQE